MCNNENCNCTEKEERFRDIVKSTSDWFWEVDFQGKYTFVFGRIKEILGYSEEEVIGKTPFDFMKKEDAEKISKIFKNIFNKKVIIKNLENWNINKNGEKVLLLTNGVPILGKNKKLLGYRGVDKDITKHRRTENRLKSLEIKLQSILIYSPYFIVTVDIFGKVININHTASELALKEVIGTSVYNYVPRDQKEIYNKYLNKSFKTKKVIKTELKDKEGRSYSVRFVPIKDYEEVNSVMIIANDITEQKIYMEESKELKNKIKNLEN
jgi:PAS domain S-box-containing protein